jgi:hypothetical protein
MARNEPLLALRLLLAIGPALVEGLTDHPRQNPKDAGKTRSDGRNPAPAPSNACGGVLNARQCIRDLRQDFKNGPARQIEPRRSGYYFNKQKKT